jgi:hypothetical protein
MNELVMTQSRVKVISSLCRLILVDQKMLSVCRQTIDYEYFSAYSNTIFVFQFSFMLEFGFSAAPRRI